MTVVDASVVIKWFVDEPDSGAARAVFLSDAVLSAPSRLVGEVARGLLRRRRAGDLSPDDAKRALVGLPSMVALAPMDNVGPLAFDIADRAHVTIYDAFYIALADQRGDVLITADRRVRTGLDGTPSARRAQHPSQRATLKNPE